MKKRATVLVPGFSKRVKHATHERLVEALDHHTDGYQLTVPGRAVAGASSIVNIKVTSRSHCDHAGIDVYENHQGDLVPS